MEKELGECHEKLYDNDRKRQVEVDALIKENNMLKKQFNDQMIVFHKLQQDMSFLSNNHETEVKLRLQFEAKLNNLHSLHRDLNSKYNRATEEIYGLEEIQKMNL